MAGYRNAGDRAIRIDMLERLADMLRAENTRSGFEAKSDMLSITGMTLEQFADLMQGLGYKAEKGERPKIKAAPDVAAPQTNEVQAPDEAETVAPQEDTPSAAAAAENVAPDTPPAADDVPEVETEVFYTFTWGRAPRGQDQQNRRGGVGAQNKGKPGRKGKRGAPQGDKPKGGQKFSARPPKPEKKIDPDNPFAAALMGLKDNK